MRVVRVPVVVRARRWYCRLSTGPARAGASGRGDVVRAGPEALRESGPGDARHSVPEFEHHLRHPDQRSGGAEEGRYQRRQGATGTYANTYGGWQQVENAAVALSEVANLVTIPGRLCENGLPVPIADPTFQKGVKALADVGVAALEAAKTKNLDKMVDVSGTISDACLVCHEKYREVPQGKMRCVPVRPDLISRTSTC